MVAQVALSRNEHLRLQVPQLAQDFEGQPPEVILQWVIEQFGPKFVLACAFGPESIILIDLLSRMHPQMPVQAFFLDTEFHFAETLQLKAEMCARFPKLDLTIVKPLITIPEQDAQYGEKLYSQNPDQCCFLRKVEPLRRALAGYDCWMSGLRREQSPTRSQTPILHWDWKRDMVKVNPLAAWTKSQVWTYILDHKLPYNPLHDQGYPSIGCAPCTHAVTHGAEERSGRWQGTGKRECGLHL